MDVLSSKLFILALQPTIALFISRFIECSYFELHVMCLITGLDYWTGILEWTTGLEDAFNRTNLATYLSVMKCYHMYITPPLNMCKTKKNVSPVLHPVFQSSPVIRRYLVSVMKCYHMYITPPLNMCKTKKNVSPVLHPVFQSSPVIRRYLVSVMKCYHMYITPPLNMCKTKKKCRSSIPVIRRYLVFFF